MDTALGFSEPCVAVIVPAFRAQGQIAAVLDGIPQFVTWIVVVDDGSPDDTAAIVRAAMLRDPRIRLVRHEVNQGVGGATLSGYREGVPPRRRDHREDGQRRADGPCPPAGLIAPIVRGEADYTKGNRYIHARQLRSMPLSRRIGNVGLSFLTKLASGYWGLFDPANGYTAIHASLVPLLDEAGIARRYFFESSMLLELSLLRAVVRDVYIPARYGTETSHLSEMDTLCRFPAALWKGLCRRVWIQYFVRDFSIASMYLVAGLGLARRGHALRCRPLVSLGALRHARDNGHRHARRAAGHHGFPVPAAVRGSGHSRPADGMSQPRPDRPAGCRGATRCAAASGSTLLANQRPPRGTR